MTALAKPEPRVVEWICGRIRDCGWRGPERELVKPVVKLRSAVPVAQSACPRCGGESFHVERKDGWVLYPIPPNKVGNLVEDLPLIVSLVGSSCYETRREDGRWYVRRL